MNGTSPAAPERGPIGHPTDDPAVCTTASASQPDAGIPAVAPGQAIGQALARLADLPSADGGRWGRREARQLLAASLDRDGLALLTAPEQCLDAAAAMRVNAAVERRLLGEPVSRIRGRREFWSLDFLISPAVLDPRPETELLVERALTHVRRRRDASLRILDLGTGSGCILLALLHELPLAEGVGIDRSLSALHVARNNARRLGLGSRASWVAGDWLAAVDARFDLILVNPPYIPAGAVATLARGVRLYDPLPALDGGPDGFAAYRTVIPQLPRLLQAGGAAFLEVGQGQAHSVAELAGRHGMQAATYPDLAGIPRCLVLTDEICACIGRNDR
jgi:release factor glutamine methyltransferase